MKTVFVLMVALGGTAWAQPVPGQMVEKSESSIALGASATVWLPSGDADQFSDTSLGLRAHFAYKFKPFLAALGTFDYVLVNEKDNIDSITYYNINAGVRLAKSGGQIEPYGEFLLGFHKIEGDLLDDSGLGFRFGGGILYSLGDRLVANAGLNYSNVSIDVSGFSVDIEAFIIEIGLATRL